MECKVFMHRNCQKMRHSNAIAHDTLISKDLNFSHEQNRSSEQEMQALTSKGFGCDVGCFGRHKTNIQLSKRRSAWHRRFGVSCTIYKFIMRDTIAMHFEKWKYRIFGSIQCFQQIKKKTFQELTNFPYMSRIQHADKYRRLTCMDSALQLYLPTGRNIS